LSRGLRSHHWYHLHPQKSGCWHKLAESRRKLVRNRADFTNSIIGHLKNYYPQVLDWVAEKDSLLFIDLLQCWPTLDQIKCARTGTLKMFMHQHNERKPELIESRINAIEHAVPLTHDEGAIVPKRATPDATNHLAIRPLMTHNTCLAA
jgi:hypothetical protein